MKTTRLGNLIEFNSGPNPTRIKNKGFESLMYTALSMEEDLYQIEGAPLSNLESPPSYFTKEGDLIIGLVKGRCSIVVRKNSELCLNSNFTKCLFRSDVLDPWFFAYWMNESEEAEFQKHIDSGKALSLIGLETLTITIPSIDRQRKIGLIYKKQKRLEYLADQKKSDLIRFAEQMIRNSLKGN
jgi:restriction endonuclease S subunit